MDSVRANDGDIDNALTTLTVTNVAYNATHVNQAVVAGGTVVNGAHGKLTIKPDGSYTYKADRRGPGRRTGRDRQVRLHDQGPVRRPRRPLS